MPFSIAAKIVNPDKPVVAVVGDSAFGFSAMELETATRYNLPLIVIILNNNGIYSVIKNRLRIKFILNFFFLRVLKA